MNSEKENAPAPIGAMELRLRRIEDRQAIHDVLMRYCRGVDRKEPALVEAAFHDDAIDNHFGVVLPFREAIGTLKMTPSASPTSSTGAIAVSSMHNICNVLIEIDGDIARAESYVNVVVRLKFKEKLIDWLHAGRYVDRFERRRGDWRIAHRTVVYDIERFDEVVSAAEGLTQARYTENAVCGQRWPADFSYEIFGLTKRQASGSIKR